MVSMHRKKTDQLNPLRFSAKAIELPVTIDDKASGKVLKRKAYSQAFALLTLCPALVLIKMAGFLQVTQYKVYHAFNFGLR